MVRGKTWFICLECGHIYRDLDIEDNATIFTMPRPCPKCGAMGYATWPRDIIRGMIERKKGR